MHETQYPQLKLSEYEDEDLFEKMQAAEKAVAINEIINASGEGEGGKSEKVPVLLQATQPKEKELLWEKPLRRQGYTKAERRLAKKNVELSLVSGGEIIGRGNFIYSDSFIQIYSDSSQKFYFLVHFAIFIYSRT